MAIINEPATPPPTIGKMGPYTVFVTPPPPESESPTKYNISTPQVKSAAPVQPPPVQYERSSSFSKTGFFWDALAKVQNATPPPTIGKMGPYTVFVTPPPPESESPTKYNISTPQVKSAAPVQPPPVQYERSSSFSKTGFFWDALAKVQNDPVLAKYVLCVENLRPYGQGPFRSTTCSEHDGSCL
ncbi:hydroxyproline-rich glycoprotein family protein [Artemisia annua]|uniref:Hydroxyproline-rich glycoprotein family protein n=1 Tax=Artemisia annua TaxID=35608 RepID=A0A2U1LY12_ARTAN|nr:hydroxyproline-rich glycoprotein family protein [Artemisia annua]